MTLPFTPRTQADEDRAITRLVDGTLSGEERLAVEEWARERPDVQRRIAAQRRVVGAFAAGGPEVPDALVDRVRHRVGERYGVRSPRRGIAFGSSVAGWRRAIPVAAVAALAVALIAIFAGGSTTAPSISTAAQLAYVPATSPAPTAQSGTLLDVSYGGVTYPNYRREFGADPTGQLQNRIGGRSALTVFYRLSNGARLSYTVFSGKPIAPPGAARMVDYRGVKLRVFNTGRLAVVTLVRHGSTCVLAAPTTQDIVLGLAEAPLREQAT
jgi:hypothetical protein